jgi:hydroxypyruvate reductase
MVHREQVLRVLDAALRAVDPREAVRGHVARDGELLRIGPQSYRLDEIGRVIVVGAGKAGAPMAAAVAEILRERISAGVVNVKYGHTAVASDWQVRFGGSGVPDPKGFPWPRPARAGQKPFGSTGPITLIQAGHPLPDAAGQAGAERIASLLQGLTDRDLVIVLLSGGGSALLPLPAPGVTLADLQALTDLLLRCGATINEINTVRKHCSRIAGGQLARLATPAQVATLILSDVVGATSSSEDSPEPKAPYGLDSIASGPTVPDPTTYADALAVLQRYGVAEQVPARVREHLELGAAGAFPDTPKPGDPLFGRVHNVVIGDNARWGG